MPLLDHLLGDVEVQERRPKSWMEPRRKRLSFVRPHNPSHSRHSSSSSRSDDWAMVPAQGNAQYFRNDAETWDLRRHEAQARWNDATIRQRDLEHRQHVYYTHQLYGPPPDLQRIHDHGRQQGLLERDIPTIRPRGHHADSDNEIIEIVSGSDDDDDDDDDWDDHSPRRQPLSIEHDRDRGRALRDLTDKDKRGKSKDKHGKGKKGDKKKKKKGTSHDDSDSDDDKKVFMEGVRAGIKASRERGSGHGGGSNRGSPRPRRRFLRDDDSDDSMDFRPTRRSRSRGRLGWGL